MNIENNLIANMKEIVDFGYRILCEKIEHGNIKIDNEAGLQLQLGFILKNIGQLFEFSKNDKFSVLLETKINLSTNSDKSGTKSARCDIELHLENVVDNRKVKCAIELKYFKKENHREPNNRYDYFADLSNLEKYKKQGFDVAYMIIGTDHEHYVNQNDYSNDTADFDFRDKKKYTKGSKLEYRTSKPYGSPIVLESNYNFTWNKYKKFYFMKTEI